MGYEGSTLLFAKDKVLKEGYATYLPSDCAALGAALIWIPGLWGYQKKLPPCFLIITRQLSQSICMAFIRNNRITQEAGSQIVRPKLGAETA